MCLAYDSCLMFPLQILAVHGLPVHVVGLGDFEFERSWLPMTVEFEPIESEVCLESEFVRMLVGQGVRHPESRTQVSFTE